MRGIAVSLAFFVVALAGLAGCGSSDSGTSASTSSSSPEGSAAAGGCTPGQMTAVLGGFLKGVQWGSRRITVNYLAHPPRLGRFAISGGAGDGGLSPHSPNQVYAAMRELTGGERFDMLGAEAGPKRKNGAPGGSARIAFVSASRRRSISGSVGIECAGNRIYTATMVAKRGLGSAKLCGTRLRPPPSPPTICGRTQ